MKSKLENIFVPFPTGMMSAVRAPLSMPVTYARDLENIYVKEDGSGTKRGGFVAEYPTLVGEEITALFDYVAVDGTRQLLANTADGGIFMCEDDTWTSVWTGLDTEAVIRVAYFDDKVILCNGVDDVLVWDGSVMAAITQWVSDSSTGLTRIDGDSFSIDSDEELYPVGQAVRFTDGDGNLFETTVSSVVSGSPLIVNVADSVVPVGVVDVAYEVKPPKFREVYAAHDRLWGIGSGVLQAGFGNADDRMRVYYTAGVNDPTAWYDEEGFLKSINLTDKTNTSDALVTMRVKDGLTIFFGQQNTQIWGGVDPTVTGDFAWQQTIPVGVVHPALVVDMPNDIGFLTRFGVRTISRTLQTEQLTVGDVGSEVDTLVAEKLDLVMQDNDLFRRVQHFRKVKEGWFGFFLGDESLVFQVNGSGKGWSRFTGFFASADAFVSTVDGELYVSISDEVGSTVFAYDGSVFSDGGDPIHVTWFTPWIAPVGGGRQFAHKALEVLTAQEAAVEIRVERMRDYDTSRPVLASTTANVAADFWDMSDWDNSYFDNGMPKITTVRDPFVANVLAYRITEESVNGPLTIFGLKVYGVKER